ncbi:RNA polymerase sigma factor [Massilia sp. CCM 8734]|uniref:RNA polymerase sigma factor n=1 Tax=Massilia sp. CCM 8734 TaxID=2609283 RepID=UPI001421F8B9|nr:RNA polymerase sigma factor [Massilia sp. CCM 8734]NIA00626.1 sigma-70 family RNA polymerase sigma factor [Massilia sp. CCM 8734]
MMSAPVSSTVSLPAAPAVDVQRLFIEHRQHLVRFVQRYTRNLEDAEDVVQSTFIEAMRCAGSFADMSKPSTWLFGIALNLARNQVRRNSADLYEAVEEGYFEQIKDQGANPAELCESRQISSRVDALLRSFPPKIRETFDVVVSRDITYEEAAEYLEVPVGTVRSRVSRVRAAVRERFGAGA